MITIKIDSLQENALYLHIYRPLQKSSKIAIGRIMQPKHTLSFQNTKFKDSKNVKQFQGEKVRNRQPLVGSPRTKNFWDPVLERCRKRVAQWKAIYPSFGGRITLIKATLSNLPIYYLSLFKIPKGVAAETERLQNHFLWGGQEASKPHLIKWKTVSKHKKFGGLALHGIVK